VVEDGSVTRRGRQRCRRPHQVRRLFAKSDGRPDHQDEAVVLVLEQAQLFAAERAS
jgi:hypothetical protein